MQNTIKKLFKRTETYIFLILLALSVLIQVRSGQFYTPNNIVDIMSAMIVPGLFAVGAFLVILSGGIDVSFPALASLTAYATTKMFLDMGYEGNVLLPILAAILIGGILGMINGFFVGYLELPAMIVTLCVQGFYAGYSGIQAACGNPRRHEELWNQLPVYGYKHPERAVLQASCGIPGSGAHCADRVSDSEIYHVRPGNLCHRRK